MTLKDDLMEINGVGEATAEKILELVGPQDGEIRKEVQEAIEFLDSNRPEHAREVLENL